MDVNLTGFLGDQIQGACGLERGSRARMARDEAAFVTHMYGHFTNDFCWPGLTDGEEKLLYLPPFLRDVRDRAFDSLAAFRKFPIARRVDYSTAILQGMRLTHANLVHQSAFLDLRYPFSDYRPMDFVLSMPMEYRMGERLYLAVINRVAPEVTWIPRDTDGLMLADRPALRRAQGWLHKAERRFNRHVLPVFADHASFHGGPEGWLRNDWWEWAGGVLFDRRTAECGIFDPAAVRPLLDRHMSGNEPATLGKLALLITIEMTLRHLLDEVASDVALGGRLSQ
jgi:asparagine synthase (glutamine-hydrolysing)